MQGTIIPRQLTTKLMVYLGPRMQAVHNAVMTEKIDTFQAAWPLAKEALARQGISIESLALPTSDAGIHPFAQSLLVRARPTFMKELKGLLFETVVEPQGYGKEPVVKTVRRDQKEASIMARREMITQGALYTFAMSGVLEESAVKLFQEVADCTYGDVSYPADLMQDLKWMDDYLTEPDLSEEGLDKLYEVWSRYVEPVRPEPLDDVWPHVWHDSLDRTIEELGAARRSQEKIESGSKDVPATVSVRGVGGRKDVDFRQHVLSLIHTMQRELGFTVISLMQEGIEARLTREIALGESSHTADDVQWMFDRGFITPHTHERIMAQLTSSV